MNPLLSVVEHQTDMQRHFLTQTIDLRSNERLDTVSRSVL